MRELDVDKILAQLSPRQLLEWQAFAMLEPFGPAADDERFEQLCQIVYAMGRAETSPDVTFFKRLPEEEDPEAALAKAKLQLEAIAMAH